MSVNLLSSHFGSLLVCQRLQAILLQGLKIDLMCRIPKVSGVLDSSEVVTLCVVEGEDSLVIIENLVIIFRMEIILFSWCVIVS